MPQSPAVPTAAILASALPPGPHSLQETYEAKRKEFLSELQRKEEEMRQMFVNKVKETELELKEKEREVRAAGRRVRGQAAGTPARVCQALLSAPSCTRSLST